MLRNMIWLKKIPLPLVGALLGIIYLLIGIFRSTNSTAAIGFVFVPLYALIGAIVGFSIEHFFLTFKKQRKFNTGITFILIGFYLVAGFYLYTSMRSKAELDLAKDPTTQAEILEELFQRKDATLLKALAGNERISRENFIWIMDNRSLDYDIMATAITNSKLSFEHVQQLIKIKKAEFKSDVEYQLYQTYVWAKLAKRSDVSQELLQELAAKEDPQHFLIIALLETERLSCQEMQKFLPQPNQVLVNMINQSLQKKGCN